MKHPFFTLFLSLSIFLGLTMPVLAQTDEVIIDPHTFPDGTSLLISDPWQVGVSDDPEVPSFVTSLATDVNLFYYSLYDLSSNEVEAGDVQGLLEFFHNFNLQAGEAAFETYSLETVEVNDYEITYYEPMTSDGYSLLTGAFVVSEAGDMLLFSGFPKRGDAVSNPNAIFEIVTTVQSGVYYFNDDSSLEYPAGWDTYIDENEYIHLTDDDLLNIRLEFVSPERLTELGATEDNLIPVLEDLFNTVINDTSLQFDPEAVEMVESENFMVMRYVYADTLEGTTYDRAFLAIIQTDGWVTVFDAVAGAGNELTPEAQELLLSIINTSTLPQ